MTGSADPDALNREIGEAIAAVVGRHERSMTTKWVALIETIDADGKRGLWAMDSDDLPPWDALGMFGYGYTTVQARIHEAQLHCDGGD